MEEVCLSSDFIMNNILGALQYQMKRRAYCIDDSDLDDETHEED